MSACTIIAPDRHRRRTGAATRHLAPALLAAFCLAVPAVAQTHDVQLPPGTVEDDQPRDSQSLIEHGITLLFQGIITEIAPDLEDLGNDLRDRTRTLWPAMEELAQLLDDIENYELPQRLENGDILIRRRADAPPPPPLDGALQNLLPRRDDAPVPDAPPEGEKNLPEGPQLDL